MPAGYYYGQTAYAYVDGSGTAQVILNTTVTSDLNTVLNTTPVEIKFIDSSGAVVGVPYLLNGGNLGEFIGDAMSGGLYIANNGPSTWGDSYIVKNGSSYSMVGTPQPAVNGTLPSYSYYAFGNLINYYKVSDFMNQLITNFNSAGYSFRVSNNNGASWVGGSTPYEIHVYTK